MKKSYQRGLGPIVVIIAIAVALGLGGTAYYSAKKAKVVKEAKVEEKTDAEVKSSGSLRSMFALGKDVTCEVKSTDASSDKFEGTVYLSGGMMRGDFVTSSATASNVESHMIRSGNDVYVWSGTEGARMNISSMTEANMQGEARGNSKANVNLDQKVDYACTAWNKDEAKFTPPGDVKFIDISAMMQGNGMLNLGSTSTLKTNIKTDINLNGNLKVE